MTKATATDCSDMWISMGMLPSAEDGPRRRGK
jgi:hypothetical protein